MTSEQILIQYNRLIHRVLSDNGQKKTDNNYEDLYQELSIKLIEIAEKFSGDPIEDAYVFTAYAQQGLQWYLIDLLRSYSSVSVEIPLSNFIFTPVGAESFSENITAFLSEAKKRLTKSENQLFQSLINGQTLSELAKDLGVSKNTMSKRKKRIIEKIKDLKHLLLK